MEIDIIDCGSKKSPEIVTQLNKLGVNTKTFSINEIEQFEPSKPLVISGAPILLTEVDPKPYLDLFKFIRKSSQPILGICFGHQILGMTHGAQVKKCPESRNDLNIDIMSQHEIFANFETPAIFNEDHCECIELPNDFELLASSSVCKVEAMAHKSAPLIGVQFHPETSELNGPQFFRNWLINVFKTGAIQF